MKKLVMLSAFSAALGLAQVRTPRNLSLNSAETILATIYEGDFTKASDVMNSLGKEYWDNLTDLKNDTYCKNSRYGDAARRGCIKLAANDKRLIQLGLWSSKFEFTKAVFRKNSTGSKNLAVYHFEREFYPVKNYQCRYILQITAILNGNHPTHQDFDVHCD